METLLSPELSIEEHALKNKPQLSSEDPISFAPVEGTQEEVLSKHQDERNKLLPDTLVYENSNFGYSAILNGQKIVATFYETPSTEILGGTLYKGYVEVSQGEQILSTIQTGDVTPAGPFRGLWTYDNQWVLEIVYAARKETLDNGLDFDITGEVIVDGLSLNDQRGYQETFGFQLIKGKPFYFFIKSGLIGISYNDEETLLGYTEVPHYACCSAAAWNPKSAENMVSFFAQRNGTWYYVEIGVFE